MRHLQLAPSWLRFLIVVLLVVGIFFRFSKLDGKVYWHDETYTSLRVSGYTTSEVKQEIFNGRVISQESFARFQHPNSEKGLGDTIASLAIEDPQNPALYYVIARWWVQIFGNSVTAIRSLSAVISLFVFPSIYWLCRELFNVPLSVPAIAIALVAISPMHLIYAQEAREFVLWIVTILISSASLLRAIRLESKNNKNSFSIFNWGLYALILAVSFYTYLLSIVVAIAHGIYVFTIIGFRWSNKVTAYLLATLAALIVFIPWILVMMANSSQFNVSTAWTTNNIYPGNLIQSWLLQLSRIFFDLNFGIENNLFYLIVPLSLSLAGYAIYFIFRTTNSKVWLFILILIVIPAIPLMLLDLFFGSSRSIHTRNLLPSYLGIQIAVAYLFATQIYNANISRRSIWRILMIILFAMGLISCGAISQADTWWNKVIGYGNPQVAQIINQSSRPLVVSDDIGINYGNIFSLSYLTDPKVRFLLMKEQKIPEISNLFTDIFLLNPGNDWQTQIATRYRTRIEVIYEDKYYSFWKLVKPRIFRQRNIRRR
jgi:uncharacterized membrane protein